LLRSRGAVSRLQDDSENNPPSTPGSPGFSTDRLPPNNTTSRGATDPSSYSDDDGEAEVDPHVLPEDDDPAAAAAPDEEDEEGEDLFNDNYLE
jgi:DNA replication licensing factor MCM2